jgi:hypothetical protein
MAASERQRPEAAFAPLHPANAVPVMQARRSARIAVAVRQTIDHPRVELINAERCPWPLKRKNRGDPFAAPPQAFGLIVSQSGGCAGRTTDGAKMRHKLGLRCKTKAAGRTVDAAQRARGAPPSNDDLKC